MSFQDGMAAINLEMPARIPRTEYSADSHWQLVNAVTGIEITADATEEERWRARDAFTKAWNYDFIWRILIGGSVFGDCRTTMGHAVYAAGGTDYSTEQHALFSEPEDVLAFDPWERLGAKDHRQQVADFEAHYQLNCQHNPDAVNMTGIYVTCISGLIELFGWEMLLTAMGTDPRAFGEMTNRYVSWVEQYFKALADARVPVVMVHDDIVWTEGAIFHPDWYRTYVFPNIARLVDPLLQSGKKVIFTSDGGYTEFIDDLVATGVHGFVLEPVTDLELLARKYGQTHVLIGNADTRVLLQGSRADIYAEVKRCMDIGRHCPGFFMAVGNHIPANTPVENALYYNEIYEKLSRR